MKLPLTCSPLSSSLTISQSAETVWWSRKTCPTFTGTVSPAPKQQ